MIFFFKAQVFRRPLRNPHGNHETNRPWFGEVERNAEQSNKQPKASRQLDVP